jgi:thiamine pyrophosphokinase
MNDHAHLKSDRLILVGPVLSQSIQPELLKTLGLLEVPQIAIDGGDRFADQPLMVVGDGDSASGKAGARVILKNNQDQTDLGYALGLIAPGRWVELHLFGFLGARIDHELASIGEVCHSLGLRPDLSQAKFYTSELQFAFSIHNTGTHSFDHLGLFSVIAFESSRISIQGQCDYQMRDQTLLPFSGRGVSNVGKGLFTVQSSGVFMMIPAEGQP